MDGRTCRERKDVATDHARAGRLDQAVNEFTEALQLWEADDGDPLRSACLQNRVSSQATREINGWILT